MAELRKIDGETRKDVEANVVHTRFAEETQNLMVESKRMSAFFILAFDEDGNVKSRLYLGSQFPMPPVMIPHVVEQCVLRDVYTPA